MATYSITDLYNKIDDLAVAKEALRQVLLNKGASVPTSVLLDDYPTIISNLCS